MLKYINPRCVIEFNEIASLPLEACQQRLLDRNERGTGWFASRRKLAIREHKNKAGDIHYRFERNIENNMQVIADIYLVPLNIYETQVYGKARVAHQTFVYLMMSIVIFATVALVLAYIAPLLIILLPPLVFLLWALCFDASNALLVILKTTLDIKSKKWSSD